MIKLEYLQYKNDEKEPVVDVIYGDMVKNIVDGILFSGFKLTEQQLTDKYHISRTPIREVLRRLETKGLIEIIKNRGAIVVGFTKRSYIDMLEERKALESLCISYAIERMLDEEMELLTENNQFLKFYYNTADISTLSKIFKGFHQIVYHSTYNSRLREQMNFYFQCSNRKGILYSFYEENLDEVYGYYNSLYQCFVDKNKEKAHVLMEKLMDLVIQYEIENFR